MDIKVLLMSLVVCAPLKSNALDLTNMVCSSPELTKPKLTQKCKDAGIAIRDTICQGNEGEVWCKHAYLDLGNPARVEISLGFRNRHVWRVSKGPINLSAVAYDSSSTGTITADLNNDCTLTNYRVDHTNAAATFLMQLAKVFNIALTNDLPKIIPDCK
ncbi:hypothetical protein [Oceanimonas doudoroffii]|uniref:hypothetical protein n=1 Tax=Oceanimonas doudoroffii TaxID=84158 RepID=UPI0011400B05|nr:hypothetical protein [Oceanimonas doudoroffii]